MFSWSVDRQNAFERLKHCLITTPVLAHPDFTKPFILDTDASGTAIGAVLSQVQDGREKVIAFASRSLNKVERKYCVTRKELLAVVHFIKYLKHYLSGKYFLVRTDHSSRQWLLNFKNPERQMARWLEVLASFDMVVQHRPGKKHANADTLSRLPCKQCNHCNIPTPGLSDKESNILWINKITESYRMDDVDLTSLQAANEELSKIMKWIKGDDRPSYGDIYRESYFIRSLWSQFKTVFCIEDGILKLLLQ